MNPHRDTGHDDPELLMDINTTPLIDVMLVLLIMFIVTIPIQPHATSLTLASGQAITAAEPKAVHIRIGPDQRIEVNGTAVGSREGLDSALTLLTAQQGDNQQISVDVHPDARYEQVAGVLAQIQRNGLKRLNIVGIDRFSTP